MPKTQACGYEHAAVALNYERVGTTKGGKPVYKPEYRGVVLSTSLLLEPDVVDELGIDDGFVMWICADG